jgi:CDP-diacylglycerol--serine O-phosphatidyltransferase
MIRSFQKLLPSLVSFTSLVCGFSAMVLATHKELTVAGALILLGYMLDGVDGALARRLGVASDFGLQLDSLVDAVTFGVAPSMLVYKHLQESSLNGTITWVACTAYVIGGVFRLTRFNLLPPKKSLGDSVGLTISTSGATLALGVLSNRAYDHRLIPAGIFLMLMVALTLLMVSRVRFPEFGSILRQRWFSLATLGVAAVLAIWISPQLVWLGVHGGYISFGLARAVYDLVR